MNSADFNKVVEAARARQDAILKAKGDDYTRHEADRLSNFKRSAAQLGLDPVVVWAIFFNKHVDAIMAFIKTGKVESEPVQGRIDDAMNYLYLLDALLKESKEKVPAAPRPFPVSDLDVTCNTCGITAGKHFFPTGKDGKRLNITKNMICPTASENLEHELHTWVENKKGWTWS